MGLSRLEINQFRNLQSVCIEPDPGLNIITGCNAAGKTSLLESIFYMSYGRSFRSAQAKHLIGLNTDFFRIVSLLDDEITRIGIQRSRAEQSIRVNRETISRISELSSLLPVLALHPDSHQLISGGPDQRRQYLDWGVFHVEHRFLVAWRKYKKALSQRNAALRQNQDDKLCSLWDRELIEHAVVIETLRVNYLDQIKHTASELAQTLFPAFDIALTYKRGLPGDLSYAEYLQDNLHKDREKGFTQSGPHRADIKITVNDLSAQTSISRGQQKKLVCLLRIAQLSLFSQKSERKCILLFDDLPAELDESNQHKIMHILSGLNIQCFITAIKADQINCEHWQTHRVFHVEHGCIELQP